MGKVADTPVTTPVTGVGAILDRDLDTVLVTASSDAAGPTFITVWPTGEAMPGVVRALADGGDVDSTATTVGVGDDGSISVVALSDTVVSIEATGYFSTADTVTFGYDLIWDVLGGLP